MDIVPGDITPPTPPLVVKNNSSILRTSLIVILGLILLGGVVGVYYIYKLGQSASRIGPVVVVEENIPTSTSLPTSVTPVPASITREQYLSLVKPSEPIKTENPSLPPEIKRINECLELTLKNGSKKSFCNAIKEGWPSTSYQFLEYIPNTGYLFHVQYWEGSSHVLVNENTGEELKLWDKPIFSENGNRFMVTSVDLEAQYNPTGFQIGQKQGDKYILIHEEKTQFGIVDPVWVNENTFYFKKLTIKFEPQYQVTEEYAKYSF